MSGQPKKRSDPKFVIRRRGRDHVAEALARAEEFTDDHSEYRSAYGWPLQGLATWVKRLVKEASMETAKEEVRRILDLLPDDATLEDVQYRIYVRQAIAAGLRDVDEGRVVSQEEVERRMARWTEK